ncbi:unnamed protein product [Danaus chrysippus]|uniref:(African queen) hypothetical protein n=1 Tax=Danaus chrysippus TaxID=151541 RepID=A0A8J2QEB3_9NEOP|nr:unnamed protein product [Danaus chrysippus]
MHKNARAHEIIKTSEFGRSTQIYKGLDIVTAKASPQERELVKHHLLDILEPHQNFTVVDFRSRALNIIDNLTEQGKIPIVVGGTNYYIESIVYNILVEDMNDPEALLWDKSRRKRNFADDIDEMPIKKASLDPSDEAEDALVAESDTKVNSDGKKNSKSIDVSKLKEDVDNERKFTNEEIHERLKAVDPVMASRLHPNNRRKVLR